MPVNMFTKVKSRRGNLYAQIFGATAKPKLEPEVLARRWGIELEAAKTTHNKSRNTNIVASVELSAVEDKTSAASILAHAGGHVYQSEVKTR